MPSETTVVRETRSTFQIADIKGNEWVKGTHPRRKVPCCDKIEDKSILVYISLY